MISESSEIKDLAKNKYFECRRQDLPDYYKFNGAIYLLNTQYFYNNFNSIYKEGVYACEMPSNRSIDIDNSFDFFLAEQILKYKKETPLL